MSSTSSPNPAQSTASLFPSVPVSGTLITRSAVPPVAEYTEYKRYLRWDFYYSCAYCTMFEAEAQAIRFAIDHYEPREARPDLLNAYDNLIYSCDECNSRKGDRCPPPSARANGFRFFRPDQDHYSEHFRLKGGEVEGLTNVGRYTEKCVDLNRQMLKRLREIRQRLVDCDNWMLQGIQALRKAPIDRLPPEVKPKVQANIRQAAKVVEEIGDTIDGILRSYAKSPLIDAEAPSQEDEAARCKERAVQLKAWQALYPGAWRAPKRTSNAGKKKSKSAKGKS